MRIKWHSFNFFEVFIKSVIMFESKAYVAYSWNILIHFTIFKVEVTVFDKKKNRRYHRTWK